MKTMQKRLALALVAVLMMALLAGCASGAPAASPAPSAAGPAPAQETPAPAQTAAESAEPAEEPAAGAEAAGSSILIAYFTMPEDVDPAGADAVAGASIVVRDGEILGNVEYMAQTIQQAVGGDLLRIETVEEYPLEHEALVDFAAEEQEAGARPALATQIENLGQYDTIFLGYPNWWGDMPQALYTFLESYDLSGKTIIPFCPHGGSGFSRTQSTIAELQPEATVREDGLTLSRNDVADSAEQVTAWAQGLGL